ncbi:MAG: hypothetical protein IJV19_05835 [Prevotella sp.]|nr:hypothetical protein [Prevotella sp.]MBQ8457915.1 hypothetical protein [Prevotella sp.]
MPHLVEDFSVEVPVADPNITDQFTEKIELRVEDIITDMRVAYTFNGQSENTAKQLYKALEKYKRLRFMTGVFGYAENSEIQRNIRSHMSRLYGDKVHQEITGGCYEDTVFELQK